MLFITGSAFIGGCETMSSEGGLGEFGRSVFGEAMNTAAATASVEMVRNTADSVCSPGNDMCRRMTMVTMAGFTDTFIEQLSQSDVRRINEAREESIRSGEVEEWSNPETGTSGRVSSEPAEPRQPQPTPVKVKRDRLESLPMMDAVGSPYVVNASGGVNVRGGPGTGYAVVDRLLDTEKVTAIGKVREQPWYLVGRGEVGIGYVFADLMEPWSAPPEEPEPAPPSEEPADETDVDQVQVEMASECFTTTQSVTLADGTTEDARVTSCRTPDGWAQV